MMTNDEFIEDIDNENTVQISRYAFNSFGIERSVRDLINWEKRGRVIIPDFQRFFVWDYNKCCKFIESILLNLPIPSMFMFRDRKGNDERYVLVDGLQRFTCVKQFVEGIYNDGDKKRTFKINIKNSEWANATYDSLSEADRDSFDDYSFKINIFDSIDTDENTKKKYMTEIFERINTGSEKLTDQEIRNAIYMSETTKMIKEQCENEKLISMLAFSSKYTSKRCYDQEFVLRCITYYHIYMQLKKGIQFIYDKMPITTSKKNMMSDYLYFCSENKIDYKNHLKSFNDAIMLLFDYDVEIFKGVSVEKRELTSTVHEVFAEAIIIFIMLGKKIAISKEEFDFKKIKYWIETTNDNNPFYSKTTSVESIKKRIEVIESFMEK